MDLEQSLSGSVDVWNRWGSQVNYSVNCSRSYLRWGGVWPLCLYHSWSKQGTAQGARGGCTPSSRRRDQKHQIPHVAMHEKAIAIAIAIICQECDVACLLAMGQQHTARSKLAFHGWRPTNRCPSVEVEVSCSSFAVGLLKRSLVGSVSISSNCTAYTGQEILQV